jgi:UDP-glucuronate 4-epimerase
MSSQDKKAKLEINSELSFDLPLHKATLGADCVDVSALAKKNLFTYLDDMEFDFVCHLAAQAGVRYSIENPDAYIESNIVGFMNILEYCRRSKIKHLVYASSSSVYGMNKKQPFSTTDNVDHPISLYAATKKSNELMAHCYSHLYGFKTTGLRFFTVYGPWGRPDMAPILFADAICNGKPINVFNHGNLERDFTYIDDIVDGVIKAINDSRNDILYKIYNIGNNQPVKLMDFITTLEHFLGKVAKKNFLPMQAGDVYSTYADITPLYEDFNYKPYTDIRTGIEKFAKWYLEYYKS